MQRRTLFGRKSQVRANVMGYCALKARNLSSGWRRYFNGSSASGGAERLSSGSSGVPPTSRTSVASNSVTTVTSGTGFSITSTMTVSTAGVVGGFTTFTLFCVFFAPRLNLALAKRFLGAALATVRFADLPRRLGGLTAALSIFLFVPFVASSVEPWSPVSF